MLPGSLLASTRWTKEKALWKENNIWPAERVLPPAPRKIVEKLIESAFIQSLRIDSLDSNL